MTCSFGQGFDGGVGSGPTLRLTIFWGDKWYKFQKGKSDL